MKTTLGLNKFKNVVLVLALCSSSLAFSCSTIHVMPTPPGRHPFQAMPRPAAKPANICQATTSPITLKTEPSLPQESTLLAPVPGTTVTISVTEEINSNH